MTLKALLFVPLFLISGIICFSQPDNKEIWENIDLAIRQKKNLATAFIRLDDMKHQALVSKIYAQFSRCWYYQMLITDLRTEDTLFFRNSGFIDSILFDPASPPQLKMLMHFLQAKRLTAFQAKSLRFDRMLYDQKKQRYNYASFSRAELDSIITFHFEQAKAILIDIPYPALEEVIWLSSDPGLFLFKPDLMDIILAEQINLTSHSYPAPAVIANKINQWLSLSQNDFIRLLSTISNESGKEYRKLSLYNEWISNQASATDSFYIETLARKFVFSYRMGDDTTQKLYENYLQELVVSPFSAVRAYGVYQLCLRWYDDASGYAPSYKYQDFDTAYQYHASKALQLYDQNKNVIDSFYVFRSVLELMKEQILSKTLKLEIESDNLPDEPILAQLNCKNVNYLYYRIVKVRFNEKIDVAFKKSNAYLSAKEPIREVTIDLSLPPDHNIHTSFLKIDPLPVGKYFILLSDKYIKPCDSSATCLAFTVTNIVVLNTDRTVFVLNRKTGMPLENAVVNLKEKKKCVTNAKGFVTINASYYDTLDIYYNNDTVSLPFRASNGHYPDNVYDKDEYDDLLEFYEDNLKMHVFTDRSIYRPGQTVYYKAVFITRHSMTGDPIVINKENLRNGSLKSYYKKWLKLSEPEMYIIDPFGKRVDTIKIIPNEYGSVSGSFIIPANTSTGEWSIESDEVENDYQNSGEFSVEEYKRPAFELVIEKPQKELKPGDEFFFKVKVKSFSGADLNNVRINYSISRSGYVPADDNPEYKSIELVDSSGYTSNDGELLVVISDIMLKKYSFSDDKEWKFTYTIQAEAIDETGESYDRDLSIDISTRPLVIKLPLSGGTYDRNKLPLPLVSVTDRNEGEVFRKIKISVYRVQAEGKIYQKKDFKKSDVWLYTVKQLENWFPLIQFGEDAEETKELIFETEINTSEYERLRLPASKFTAGNYIYEADCRENNKITGYLSGRFSVYDLKEKKLAAPEFSFHKLAVNYMAKGDTIRLLTGNSETDYYSVFHISWYSKSGKKRIIKDVYDFQKQEKGLNEWRFRVPDDAVDQIRVTRVCVLNNEIVVKKEDIYLKKPGLNSDIIFEQYRQILHPGASETFTVSIKTKNDNIASELMTTMYDASLDKLENHKWRMPSFNRDNSDLADSWPWQISTIASVNSFYNTPVYMPKMEHSKIKWWMSYTDPAGGNKFVVHGDVISRLQGVTNGLLLQTKGFEEVIVASSGYEIVRANASVGANYRIRGLSSIVDLKQPLIILDGFPYEGDLAKLDPALITQAIVLKDAMATSIYGARAGSGVLVISTKGEIKLPIFKPEPVIKIRKDFNETAFFSPKIYADKDGYYKVSFTIPESVTEWNWKLMSHTKKAQFIYAERKIHTQLPLMVQPNMPRFLYQGDRMILQNRISNLDTAAIAGKSICRVEDAVTGQDITSSIVANPQIDFFVDKKSTAVTAFELKTPPKQLNPLKIVIIAKGIDYADAEEHIIPVLSTNVLVKKSVLFSFSQKNDTLINPVLPLAVAGKNGTISPELYGIGLSIAPKPQAALINSLPYLANYSYDCAEQVFNKLLAYATAIRIVQTDEQARESFKRAQLETLKKSTQGFAANELSEDAMPWLNLSSRTQLQQKQLLQLLDTVYSRTMIGSQLDKLYKLQNLDGGLAWFNGGPSNRYISVYVLSGLGKLMQEGWVPDKESRKKYQGFINRLLLFSDKFLAESQQDGLPGEILLYYSYARSFWMDNAILSNLALNNIRDNIRKQWKTADRFSLHNQALLIINTFRYFQNDSLNKKALEQLSSIRQSAISDEVNGIRWKDFSDTDDLSITTEETVGLLGEAFGMSDEGDTIIPALAKWLLLNRSEYHWSTTKGTSAALTMLRYEGKSITGVPQTISSRLKNNELLTVSDDLLSGNAFSFAQTSDYSPVNLRKQSGNPAYGGLSWYYFVPAYNMNDSGNNIKVIKTLYRYNDETKKWEEAAENIKYKITDKIRVSVSVETSKSIRYVYLDDKHSAAFESVEHKSGYEYASNFSYYKSVRDAGVKFFTEFLPAGKSEFVYELKVVHEGNFTNGPAVLQCMYNPAISAFSNAISVRSEKQ